MTLVVGTHPQNLSLSILARRPSAVAALREAGLGFLSTAQARKLFRC
jgi:sulfonate transport system substrate-binding protein